MVAISLALIFNLFLGPLKYPGEKPKPPALALRIGPLLLAGISLIFGLFPADVARLLLKPAIVAIHPSIDTLKLGLWHGFNEVLLVSFITVAAGVVLFLLYRKINRWLTRFNNEVITFRFAKAFNQGLDLFLSLTKKKTAIVQSGYQRFYLMAIFVMTSVLAWYQLAYTWQGFNSLTVPSIFEILLLMVLVAATVFTVAVKSRLAAILALGAVGYSIGLLFIIYGAIDLAITMMLAETLVLVMFMAVVYHLPKFTNFSSKASRLRDAAIALLVGGFMTGLVLKAGQLNLNTKISDFYTENALSLAYGKNVVNVILVDFRALDTLGEITVLAIAAIGVMALLKLKTKKGSAT
jgi:multicomponent Na+:H+ antiporter subunit A